MHPALTIQLSIHYQSADTQAGIGCNTCSLDGPYAAKMTLSVSLQAIEVIARLCNSFASCSVKLPVMTPAHEDSRHKCHSTVLQ